MRAALTPLGGSGCGGPRRHVSSTASCPTRRESKIDICPVFDGMLQPGAVRLDFGGRDLSALLRGLLRDQGGERLSPFVVDRLKEVSARAALSPEDYEAALRTCSGADAAASEDAVDVRPQTHVLPDGQQITVRGEGLQLGEALFRPEVLGLQDRLRPLHELVFNACQNSPDPLARKVMTEGAFLCGGGSTIPGAHERFFIELETYSPPSYSVLGNPCPEYMPTNSLQFSAWTGGVVVAKLAFPHNQHVTRGEYAEHGPTIIHKKCV